MRYLLLLTVFAAGCATAPEPARCLLLSGSVEPIPT